MKIYQIISLAAVGSMLAGCSNLQTEYEKQKMVIKQQKVVIQELNATNQHLKTDNVGLRTKLRESVATSSHQDRLDSLSQNYQSKLEEMISSLSAQLDGAGSGMASVTLHRNQTGEVVLRMDEKVVFKPGDSTLSSSGKSVLSKVLGMIERYPEKYFRVDGHSDTDPIRVSAKKYSSNWDLSAKRATRVIEYLTSKSSLDPSKFYLAAFSQYSPVSSSSSKSANRRVEIVITDGK
ncbi:MAG: OmpA family protein [Planctomycetes bacterium]|nr:OmpA family protein [Planctomycetota bacterium]